MSDTGSFKLIIEDDEGRRSVVPVDLGEVSIGRLDGNTVRLNERNVSRRHARLVRENGGIWADDLDSYNGVWINGSRVKGRHEVRDGDLIKIGDFQLELRGEGLQSRAEETTQRTPAPDMEATQPQIRVEDDATPEAADAQSESKQREEPTAIIRMSHIDDVEASRREVKSMAASMRPKLVCVSSQLAGMEFEVKKTESVIGRTEDNDITVDHRSVSRHHAKIVAFGRSVRIVDLNSANGTLVNGEEYAQTDLKRGDLIELGHVRFRFVPAGEEYTLSGEELSAVYRATGTEAESSENEKSESMLALLKANPLLVGAIGGLAVVLVLMVGILVGGSEKSPTVVDPASANDGTSDGSQLGNGAESEASAEEVHLRRLYQRAEEKYSQTQWVQAASLGRAVLELQPEHSDATQLVHKAEIEIKAKEDFDEAVRAINESAWSDAWNGLQEIPDASYYAKQARELVEQVRAALISERVDRAEDALKAQKWQRAQELADEIASLDPGRPEIERIRTAIAEGRGNGSSDSALKPRQKTARLKTTPAKAKNKPKPRVEQDPAPPPPPPKAVAEDAKSLFMRGRELFVAGEHQKAIEYLNRCLKADSRFCLCYRTLGIAHANLNNMPKAYRYYKKYVEICPTAKDAPAVRQLIKDYEQQQ